MMEEKRITKKIAILYWFNQKNLKKILPASLIPGQMEAFINLTPDTEIRQDELVSKIGVTKAIGTRVIKKFDEAGFIRRRHPPKDRRISLLSLTDNGAATKRDVLEIYTILNESLFKDFTPEEQKTFHKLVDKMIVNAQQMSQSQYEESELDN